jgi:acyl dehydratase
MPLDLSAIGEKTAPHPYPYTWKETVLYALGVGAKRDELDFLYEKRGPKVLPTFAVVPKLPSMITAVQRLGADLTAIVHSTERVRVFQAFAPSGTLWSTATVRAVYDLRKFATVVVDTETQDDQGQIVATTTSSILVRGAGGFGGEAPPRDEPRVSVPKGVLPTFHIEETTSPESALLYRLSGDPNPLHADPELAAAVGFPEGPILHGLCTFGHMLRHAASGAFGGDATRIFEIACQFRRPVWPGDTLVTEGWLVETSKVVLQVRVNRELVVGSAWASGNL